MIKFKVEKYITKIVIKYPEILVCVEDKVLRFCWQSINKHKIVKQWHFLNHFFVQEESDYQTPMHIDFSVNGLLREGKWASCIQ